jgi:hypothetical protein
LKGIKIIRYEESVYFANVDNFKYKIIKLSQNHPYELADKMNSHIKSAKKELKKVLTNVKLNKMQAVASGLHLDKVCFKKKILKFN